VDHDRLCFWLGLPPASWPPDHYTLLGLARGKGDVAEVEARVLDRMEQIRPHQLLHPELVTEGMNRLAQALICLTDSVARAAYDRSLGIPPPPFEVVEDEPEAAKPLIPTQQIELPSDEVGPLAAEIGPEGPHGEAKRLPYEVVEEPNPPRKPPPYEVVPDAPRRRPPPLPYEVVPDEELPEAELIPAEVVEPLELPESAEPLSAPVSRRGLYRRLAAIRKAMRAWEKLGPTYGTPAEALATPVAVLLLVQALAEAREALPGVSRVIRGPESPGGMVAALVRLPHAIHAVRVLLPAQRQAVARDWRRGYEALRRERVRLREMVLAARPRAHREPAIRVLRAVRRTPEWVLLLAALAALFIALLRRNS
jgi:hypothetical protein